MSNAQIATTIAILAIIVGPILSVVGVLLTVRFTRKSDKEEIKVSEKDSTTAQFVALTEGYQATFEQLKEDIAEAKAEAASNKQETARLTIRVNDLEKINAEQKTTIDENTKERDEILKYLEEVVNMVPVPPGPPPRPSRWRVKSGV